MDDVETRRKDIVYASRSDRAIEANRQTHNLRRAVLALWEALTPEAQQNPHLSALADLGCTTTMHIVRLVHRGELDELACKDYEFSSASFAEHRAAGHRDATRRLGDPAWLNPVPPDIGVVVHDPPPPED
ncbi:MAG: DUF3734 domain-containing protein [Stellaceae bacterium]